MGYGEITYEVADRIATVTLNRPDRLNAWTAVMGREVRAAMDEASRDDGVRAAMDEASRDDGVRVIVLTGAGRGFCAGADMDLLSGIQGGGSAAAQEVARPPATSEGGRPEFSGRYAYFPLVPKPIIAAINGATAGLGLVIALYCDVRVAADTAVFTTAFSRRGLIAEHGISWMLPRLVGLSHALDLLLSARKIDAGEALRMGLVNQVVPRDALMANVRAYAKELAELVSPRSMAVMKRQLWDAQFQTLTEATTVADEEMGRSFGTADFKEGVAHFVEKRPPRFTGR